MMHDCREMQDNLIDVIFDEAEGAARSRLLAEIERCPSCAAEYRSFAATLDACGAAAAALAPAESYWPEYHAALTRRLRDAAGERQPAGASSGVPRWKRLLTTSIRVPAPLAAAAALLLVATSVFTLTLVARRAPEPVVLAAPGVGSPPPEAAPQIKFIEVPVVREKIVTQIIYLPRRSGGGDERGDARRENLAGVGRQKNAPPAPAADTATARPNLSGFKPAGDVNLRIIKGGDAREQ
jgi:hypothetical protein